MSISDYAGLYGRNEKAKKIPSAFNFDILWIELVSIG